VLRQHFTPEFLGRLDKTVVFEPLNRESMIRIAQKYLNQLAERASVVGMALQLPEELPALLTEKCRNKDGARQLRRMVQSQVEGPLASFLLRCPRKPAKIQVRVENGEVCFKI
jgi:ATP-dependent Clp protease ATP-binding subunit ClpC